MNILEAKSEYLSQGKPWTPSLEKRYNAALLKEKQKLFSEMEIPFPKEIETKFYEAIAKGNRNAEVYLNNLCHSHIQYALDHYAEVLYDKLIAEHGGDTIYEREMKKILGRYGTKELIKSGLVECCGAFRGDKLYAI